MKTIIGLFLILLIYTVSIIIFWAGLAQLAVHFLPEPLWIITAAFGLLVGIALPTMALEKFYGNDKNSK